MLRTYRKLFSILDARERRRAGLVFALVFVVALLQTGGVASIMPFIAVLAKPEVVQSNATLAAIYHGLGFTSEETFLFFLGVAVFVVFVGSLFMMVIGAWAQVRFSQNRNHTWSCRLMAGYLGQPYEWFLNRNTNELGANVLAEVNQVVTGALLPAMQAVSGLLTAICLVGLLVAVEPVLAFAAAIILGAFYGSVEFVSRARLARIGTERQQSVRGRFKVLGEAMGGIKDLKVGGLERQFVDRFSVPSQRYASVQISATMLGQLPSFAMQGILFGSMLLAILYLLATKGNFQRILPVLSVFALAGYRLMPALQSIFRAVAQMRYTDPALDALCDHLSSLPPYTTTTPTESPSAGAVLGSIETSVQLSDVTYSYPEASQPALRGVTLSIPARTTHGLVGSTGSGKTTIVDVLLGLLEPQVGSVIVDGTAVSKEHLRRWQQLVGYVPQQIFLADDTVRANIAFGVPRRQVDEERVEQAAEIANLHDFVVHDLPQGYSTIVGERGVRLSGGQRQRIGIARALYRDPELLILDEATSALDNLTERAVMEAVHNLTRQKTIILVAHRLSTVRECDRIHLVEAGRVIASGPYDRLVEESPEFRALSEVG